MSPCSKNLQHSHHTLADMIIKIIFLKSNKNLWLMRMKELLKKMAGIVKHGFFFRARKYLSYYHGELWENTVPSKATLHKYLHIHFHINSPDICHHVVTLHRYCIENVLDIIRIFPGRSREEIWPSLLPWLAFHSSQGGSDPFIKSLNGEDPNPPYWSYILRSHFLFQFSYPLKLNLILMQ